MILDHIAIRSKNRHAVMDFLGMFGWKKHTEFDLKFDDGSTTDCLVLQPTSKVASSVPSIITDIITLSQFGDDGDYVVHIDYQLPPEIFISDGAPDSIVGKWVEKYGTTVHHLAFRVNPNQIDWFLEKKPHLQYLSKEPIVCDGLRQIFIQMPDSHLVIELIERTDEGFCRESVKKLMESTNVSNR